MAAPSFPNRIAPAAVLAALAVLAVPAHAALTVYTTATAFANATSAPATDTFDTIAVDFLSSPANRSAGPYAYTVSAPGGLYGSGSSADVWLSTNLSGDVLTFTSFAANARAVAGFFFASDITGALLTNQTVVLTATDSFGARSIRNLTNPTATTFVGYQTNGTLVSLTVEVVSRDAYATVNNLVLAQPVPEPATYALWLAGLTAMAGLGRVRGRRRVKATGI